MGSIGPVQVVPCLQSTPRLSVTVADLVIRITVRRSQTDSVGSRCGQSWWSASGRRQRQANHLIRRELHAGSLPGSTYSDLLRRCPASRNSCRFYSLSYGQKSGQPPCHRQPRWKTEHCQDQIDADGVVAEVSSARGGPAQCMAPRPVTGLAHLHAFRRVFLGQRRGPEAEPEFIDHG
jgi:hypothetical protein